MRLVFLLLFSSRTFQTGALVEHHLVNPPEPKLDYNTHFYQLVLDTERQTFDIYIDTVNSRNADGVDWWVTHEPHRSRPEPA